MPINRRELFVGTAAVAAAAKLARAAKPSGSIAVPNGSLLPWKDRGGVKVFHLKAAPLEHEIAPGLRVHMWGYNGSTPGPVLEAVEGDRVRIYVTNALPEATTIHWHGILVPSGMDGVAGVNQPAIAPGKTYKY